MKTICIFLADGFEEIEAITPVGVPVVADKLFEEIKEEDIEMILLPGGLPGATNLYSHKGLRELILHFAAEKKPLSAICAAPFILGHHGLLAGNKATCYPGFENHLKGAEYTAALVQADNDAFNGRFYRATLKLNSIVENAVTE